eukprot:353017-Chlamydomonas_euryale.AAC.14
MPPQRDAARAAAPAAAVAAAAHDTAADAAAAAGAAAADRVCLLTGLAADISAPPPPDDALWLAPPPVDPAVDPGVHTAADPSLADPSAVAGLRGAHADWCEETRGPSLGSRSTPPPCLRQSDLSPPAAFKIGLRGRVWPAAGLAAARRSAAAPAADVSRSDCGDNGDRARVCVRPASAAGPAAAGMPRPPSAIARCTSAPAFAALAPCVAHTSVEAAESAAPADERTATAEVAVVASASLAPLLRDEGCAPQLLRRVWPSCRCRSRATALSLADTPPLPPPPIPLTAPELCVRPAPSSEPSQPPLPLLLPSPTPLPPTLGSLQARPPARRCASR